MNGKVGEVKIECVLKEYKSLGSKSVGVYIIEAGVIVIFRSDIDDLIIPRSQIK